MLFKNKTTKTSNFISRSDLDIPRTIVLNIFGPVRVGIDMHIRTKHELYELLDNMDIFNELLCNDDVGSGF